MPWIAKVSMTLASPEETLSLLDWRPMPPMMDLAVPEIQRI
jgi:hypothetical protein